MKDIITLAHGAGGKQTSELISNVFNKYFENPYLTNEDAAVLSPPKGRMAMTTDGFIVSPLKFKGGDIGKLSISGTVNDLTCMGAKPLYISCAFVIEEGTQIELLEMIAKSMAETAREVGVNIVSGDTKVAGRGQVDGVFITTTGIGEVREGLELSSLRAKPEDVVIVTGDIGRHGAAILLERDDFGIEASVESDNAPLWNPVNDAISSLDPNEIGDIHVIRDATRGGTGTVLYEIAKSSNVGIKIDNNKLPVSNEVTGICKILGLDPLYLACEGRLVIILKEKIANKFLKALKQNEYTRNSAIIGKVSDEMPGLVTLKTEIGTEAILPEPTGELLPRIC